MYNNLIMSVTSNVELHVLSINNTAIIFATWYSSNSVATHACIRKKRFILSTLVSNQNIICSTLLGSKRLLLSQCIINHETAVE